MLKFKREAIYNHNYMLSKQKFNKYSSLKNNFTILA